MAAERLLTGMHERISVMPIYEFICADCATRRDVLVEYEAKKGLKLLCARCGGVMRAAEVSGFTVITSSTAADKRPVHPQRAKACGHTHACRCAIKLTRPNPFQAQVGAALEKT